MTREDAIAILKHNVLACLRGTKWGEALEMAIKALEQEPILDKVKQAREEIENEVKFWSEPSKYNVESVVNARKAKAQSYKHCLEILDKLIESEEV